jgi:hypothetical protein
MRYSHAIIVWAFAQGALSAACKPLELVFGKSKLRDKARLTA